MGPGGLFSGWVAIHPTPTPIPTPTPNNYHMSWWMSPLFSSPWSCCRLCPRHRKLSSRLLSVFSSHSFTSLAWTWRSATSESQQDQTGQSQPRCPITAEQGEGAGADTFLLINVALSTADRRFPLPSQPAALSATSFTHTTNVFNWEFVCNPWKREMQISCGSFIISLTKTELMHTQPAVCSLQYITCHVSVFYYWPTHLCLDREPSVNIFD